MCGSSRRDPGSALEIPSTSKSLTGRRGFQIDFSGRRRNWAPRVCGPESWVCASRGNVLTCSPREWGFPLTHLVLVFRVLSLRSRVAFLRTRCGPMVGWEGFYVFRVEVRNEGTRTSRLGLGKSHQGLQLTSVSCVSDPRHRSPEWSDR